MSLPAYPEYKDSGTECLGKVPVNWNLLRLKNVLSQRITDGPHLTPVFVAEGIPFLSVDAIQDGDLVFDGCRYVTPEDHATFSKKVLPRADDILMGKAASTGKIARVKVTREFSIWSPLALIRVDQTKCDPRFVEYSLKSPETQAEIDILCTANTQKNISMDDIPLLALCNPSIGEQKSIAFFLDYETSKIDALIAEQVKLLTLLAEKRQATISQAVTKGLNPDVPMKDSGVEWLGEIPAHWETMPCKHTCLLIKDGTHLPPPRIDGGIPLLSVRNIQSGHFSFRSDDSTISESDYKELCRSFVPKSHDVLLAIVGGTIGKTAVVPENFGSFHIQRSLAIFRTNDCMHYSFLHHLFQASTFQQLLWGNVGFSAQPGIYLGALANFKIPVPPVNEQVVIANYLESSTAQLDKVMNKATKMITHLKERRAALISAAVTGKIDVRNYQVKETA